MIQLKGVYVEQLLVWRHGKFPALKQAATRTSPRSRLPKVLWAYILCVLIEKMRKRPSAEAGFIERCLLSTAFSVST